MKKIIILIIVSLVIIGAVLFFLNDSETKEPNIPKIKTDNTIDAEGLIWGTEIELMKSGGDSSYYKLVDVINNVLKLKNIKIRVNAGESRDKNNFCTNFGCSDLEKTAEIFHENNWSMMPMFLYHPVSENAVLDEEITEYSEFIIWFLDNFKNSANIKKIELINAPGIGKIWEKSEEDLYTFSKETYEKVKEKYPNVLIGTPGFEYFNDLPISNEQKSVKQAVYFMENPNFDFWAFHGYSIIGKCGKTPPTKKSEFNKYAGINEIKNVKSQIGNIPIIDTEFTFGKNAVGTNDKLSAAYIVQSAVLKKSIAKSSGLAGVMPLKIRCYSQEQGDDQWASLNTDCSATKTLNSFGILLDKLKIFKYNSHVSGKWDDENTAWIEKFTSSDKELYIFFKPFKCNNGINFDNEIKTYELKLNSVPKSVKLIDILGNEKTLQPSKTISLKSENTPQYLEIDYK